MKKIIAVLAIVVAAAEFHSAGAAVVLTNLNPKSLLNTDFDLGAFARADINTLPISGTQQGGSYRVNAGVNGVGSVSSGSAAAATFSLTITNNTAFVIDSINLSGTAFQLKGNTSSLAETLVASVSGVDLADPSVLDIHSVVNAGGANNPPATAPYNVTLSNLNLAVGGSFTITWTDANDAGTDAFFGINNITVDAASAVPEPSTLAILMVGCAFGIMYLRRARA